MNGSETKVSEYKTECIICLDSNNSIHKMKCCNSYYHKECLKKGLVSMRYFQCPHCKRDLERNIYTNNFINRCILLLLITIDLSTSFTGSMFIIRFSKEYTDKYQNVSNNFYIISNMTVIISIINMTLFILYTKYIFYKWKYDPLYEEEEYIYNNICNHFILHIFRLITYIPIVIFSSIVDDRSINKYYLFGVFYTTIPYILFFQIILFFFMCRKEPKSLINPRSKIFSLLKIPFEDHNQNNIDVDLYLV